MPWLTLILTLPTENATARMRAWRSLKSSGAAVLRDGVYLLPEREDCRSTFEAVAADVIGSGGNAYVLRTEASSGIQFQSLFDRTEEYGSLLSEIHKVQNDLTVESASTAIKHIRKLRKSFLAIAEIDFFPNQAQKQADAALRELEVAINRLLSPNEPQSVTAEIQSLSLADYQGKIWATRRRPWVDRLASAWLIRRCIDKDAQFLWLESPADCPARALGFDFDGATFSHIGNKVTYEVLLASFRLEEPSLLRIGALVHYLDVGGVQPPDSIGVESVLAGLRDTIQDDDQLLTMACSVFDGLFVTYTKAQSK
jgi:hypothetical protein